MKNIFAIMLFLLVQNISAQCEDYTLPEVIQPQICIENLIKWSNLSLEEIKIELKEFEDKKLLKVLDCKKHFKLEIPNTNPNAEAIINEIERENYPFKTKDSKTIKIYKFTAFIDGNFYKLTTNQKKEAFIIELKRLK